MASSHQAQYNEHDNIGGGSGYPAEKTGFQDLTPGVHPIQDNNYSNGAQGSSSQYGGGQSFQQGEQDGNQLRGLEPGTFHNITGTTHIPGEENQDPEMRNKTTYLPEENQDDGIFKRPQGELEYPGRDTARVGQLDSFGNMSLRNGNGDQYGQDANRESSNFAPEQREAEQQREMDGNQAGIGAIGSSAGTTSRFPHDQLQPSRSYIADSRPATVDHRPDENFGQQVPQEQYGREQPLQQDFVNGATPAAGAVGTGNNTRPASFEEQRVPQGVQGSSNIDRQPSFAGTQRTQRTATQPLQTEQQQQQPQQQSQFIEGEHPAVAVGTGYADPMHQHQQQELPSGQDEYLQQNEGANVLRQPTNATNRTTGRQSYITGANGPTTGVQPLASPTYNDGGYSPRARPVSGGGLGAALATSGHSLTKNDKKSLKTEIKTEKKFEKTLQSEAKQESYEIEQAMKQSKQSVKKADKSLAYENSFRRTYEKAIKKEVAAKQRLLKFTNEYNKVAADLERATKEMEIRRNNHLADKQTRDADQQRIDDLRTRKGQNDMDREAKHGESLTKQAQAKRALSMSTKRSSVFG